MKIYLILLTFLFCAIHTNAQTDQDAMFLKSKGKWKYPMDSVSKILTSQERQHLLDLHDYSKAITFFSDTSRVVRAVHQGIVVLAEKIDDVFLVLTKFGNYFIVYFGVIDPQVKKGDELRANDLIGYCGKNLDDQYCIDMSISKGQEDLEPDNWFAKLKSEKK